MQNHWSPRHTNERHALLVTPSEKSGAHMEIRFVQLVPIYFYLVYREDPRETGG